MLKVKTPDHRGSVISLYTGLIDMLTGYEKRRNKAK
jgi:hypothetical protein